MSQYLDRVDVECRDFMKKRLIQNETEYRQFALEVANSFMHEKVDEALGIIYDGSCYDYNDNNEPVDEAGKIIPEMTPENMQLEDWVKELSYPFVIVYSFLKEHDRHGEVVLISREFVTLSDFKQ